MTLPDINVDFEREFERESHCRMSPVWWFMHDMVLKIAVNVAYFIQFGEGKGGEAGCFTPYSWSAAVIDLMMRTSAIYPAECVWLLFLRQDTTGSFRSTL